MTRQVRLLPPPSMMLLHWATDDMSVPDLETVVVQPNGGSTPAAARQAVAVTTEKVTPVVVTVLSTSIVQVTSLPAPVG